jgi:hypothetical protein
MSDRRESDSRAVEGTVYRIVGRETARAIGQWAGDYTSYRIIGGRV